MQTLNINDFVWLKLNGLGKRLVKIWSGRFDIEVKNGWARMQLWEVMQVFGSHLHLGFKEPFDTNIALSNPHLDKEIKNGR